MLDSETAASLTDVPNIRQQGTRISNWLNRSQPEKLLAVPDREKLIGKRDHAILALLMGCGRAALDGLVMNVDPIKPRKQYRIYRWKFLTSRPLFKLQLGQRRRE